MTTPEDHHAFDEIFSYLNLPLEYTDDEAPEVLAAAERMLPLILKREEPILREQSIHLRTVEAFGYGAMTHEHLGLEVFIHQARIRCGLEEEEVLGEKPLVTA